MGKNHTFYVQNDNEERFAAEPDKGPLLNNLLASHYAGTLGVEEAKSMIVDKLNTREDSLKHEKSGEGGQEKAAL